MEDREQLSVGREGQGAQEVDHLCDLEGGCGHGRGLTGAAPATPGGEVTTVLAVTAPLRSRTKMAPSWPGPFECRDKVVWSILTSGGEQRLRWVGGDGGNELGVSLSVMAVAWARNEATAPVAAETARRTRGSPRRWRCF